MGFINKINTFSTSKRKKQGIKKKVNDKNNNKYY